MNQNVDVQTTQPRVVVPLGTIVATPGALESAGVPRITQCLQAHATGDWGCVCEEDKQLNNLALKRGKRILSAYPIDPSRASVGHGENTLWIITEWDRSVTTALLPNEY